jgi:hypothetical protein
MPALRTHQGSLTLRAFALMLAVILSRTAAGEPMDAPDDENALHENDAARPENEVVLPDGEPLDLSTPTPEEMRGIGKTKGTRLFPIDPRSDLDAKVGIDYRKPAIPAVEFQPDQLLAGTALQDQSIGTAWANVTTGLPLGWAASIDTRLDPSQEQGKVGTTLSRSVPLSDNLSMTMQNGLAMSRTFANPAPPGPTSATSQSWSSSQALRFNILPTDTTVSLGAHLSSTDEKWLRTLSAEQKLFGGPFSVTGSVSETPSGEASTSLKAGFKRTW